MMKGDLRHAGRKVNPEKFNPKDKDLQKLVGWCQSCGKLIRGLEALPHPDPFREDVYNNATPVVQCDDCDHISRMEI